MRNWNDPVTAPKDGTILRLLIRQGQDEQDAFTPFDDSLDPYETIGFNSLANTKEDRWQFAGWDWQQDCFVTGAGEVIGWLPFGEPTQPTQSTDNNLASHLDATALRTVSAIFGLMREHNLRLAHGADRDLPDAVKAQDEGKEKAACQVIIRDALQSVAPPEGK